jgi:beta-fructofuranosidase
MVCLEDEESRLTLDPCSFAYIKETEEFLLCYQWSETSQTSYGERYGTCVSKDLAVWHDRPHAIEKGYASYDSEACFSGSILSRIEHGKTVLYLYYTSVSALPIFWKLPYQPGCETQSLAISHDLGKSWQRHRANPLLKQPPAGTNTTGWRDPFVSTWPQLAKLRGKSQDTAYMLLSSGKRDFGPCVLLYESDNLVDWRELSELFSAKRNSPLTPPAPGLHYGENFECVSFATIGESLYLFFGVETAATQSTRHEGHLLIWHRGRIENPAQPRFLPFASGTLDHDILYAVHTTRSDHGLLQFGWVDEDCNKHKLEQDWSGVIGLPRKVFEFSAPAESRSDEHAWTRIGNTMTTLGLDVFDNAKLLRGSNRYNGHDLPQIRSSSFELELRLPIQQLVFCCRTSATEATRIIVGKSAITLDRSRSSLDNGNPISRSGHFVPLSGELLHLRVFCDGSLLEIFANGRFCMTSRIYPSPDALGMSLSTAEPADLSRVAIYTPLKRSWPERSEAY